MSGGDWGCGMYLAQMHSGQQLAVKGLLFLLWLAMMVGLLITTSGSTKEVRTAASEQGRLPVALIDGDRVAAPALEHKVGAISDTIQAYRIDPDSDLFKPPHP